MKSSVYKNGQTAYIGRIVRTKFQKPLKSVKTSMTIGKLYPVRWEEVLPGTNWKSDTSFTCTLTSAYLRPVKDDLFIDHYTFFVPLRLLMDDLEDVFGNSNPSAYTDGGLIEIPATTSVQSVVSKSVADYLELPVGDVPPGISILPFRAFALIYNEWIRNQQVEGEVVIQKGDTVAPSEKFNTREWSPSNYTGKLPNVTRLKDYFSVAVPSPQKGEAVPVGVAGGFIPLDAGSEMHNFTNGKFMRFGPSYPADEGNDPEFFPFYVGNAALGGMVGYDGLASSGVQPQTININATNLGIDASQIASANVNDLRMAFALQRMQELDIFGGRYREYLLAHYNVNNGDARMQVPEFLGGKRCPLFNQTVAQTSQPSADSPLGALAGFSDTAEARSGAFSKAFTEHGYIMTVACIRQRHTYQQGINVKWTRKQRADFYDPCFAHIGNQPIWQSELFGTGKTDIHDNVFGYKEAWSEYKQSFNVVSGEARSAADNSLDLYHFADLYETAPVLGQQFIEETDDYVARCLAVDPAQQDPFFVDWCFRDTVTLPMPVNCDPGLIDHRG